MSSPCGQVLTNYSNMHCNPAFTAGNLPYNSKTQFGKTNQILCETTIQYRDSTNQYNMFGTPIMASISEDKMMEIGASISNSYECRMRPAILSRWNKIVGELSSKLRNSSNYNQLNNLKNTKRKRKIPLEITLDVVNDDTFRYLSVEERIVYCFRDKMNHFRITIVDAKIEREINKIIRVFSDIRKSSEQLTAEFYNQGMIFDRIVVEAIFGSLSRAISFACEILIAKQNQNNNQEEIDGLLESIFYLTFFHKCSYLVGGTNFPGYFRASNTEFAIKVPNKDVKSHFVWQKTMKTKVASLGICFSLNQAYLRTLERRKFKFDSEDTN